MKRLIFILSTLLLAANAQAATYYVRADGTAAKASATGPETDAAACMSMATHNASTFSADDVIVISGLGGEYNSVRLTVVSSGTSGHPIVYNGSNSPVINGDGTYNLRIFSKSYVTLNKLTFTTNFTYPTGSTNIIVNQCVFKGNASGHNVLVQTSCSLTFNNCVFHGAGSSGIDISTTGNTVVLRNCLIYGNNSGGVTVAASNTLDYDYCLITGNGSTLAANVSGAGTLTDGGHNVVAYEPKVTSYKANTAYFCLTADDRGNIQYFRDVIDAMPIGVKMSFFPQTYGLTAEDEANLAEISSRGHEIGIHTHSHSEMSSTTAFAVTTTNAAPTFDVDVATTTITLATTTPGNTVTLDYSGNKSITDLRSAIVGKAWTITNTTNIQDFLFLSSLADTSGAQAVPYTANLDRSAPNYMFFYNEVNYPASVLEGITGKAPTSFVYPFGTISDAGTEAYLLSQGYMGARFGTGGNKSLSSINVYRTYAIGLSTLKGDGTESTIRQLANHYYALAKNLGYAIAFIAHDATEFTAEQWGWLADELVKLGAVVTTYTDMIARIKADHSTADNITYTKTYSDVSNYRLLADSMAIDAGTTVSGITTDYYGGTVPVGAAPDIGLNEQSVSRIWGKSRWATATGVTRVTRP